MPTTQSQPSMKAQGDALAAVLRKTTLNALPQAPVRAEPPADGASMDLRRQLVTAAVRAALFAIQSAPLVSAKRSLAKWGVDLVLSAGDMLETGTRPWFDRTYIRVTNSGSIAATVAVGDERIHLEPAQAHTVAGAWAAFIVRITNMSDDPRAQFTVYID